MPGDEAIVATLAGEKPLDDADAAGLLADDRTFYLVAFEGDEPVGFLFAHELLRRRGDRSQLFVYDVDVAEPHRRTGIGKALLRAAEDLAREHGMREGFVLTNQSNAAAMALYGSVGGIRPNEDDVLWDFEYAVS